MRGASCAPVLGMQWGCVIHAAAGYMEFSVDKCQRHRLRPA